MQKLQKKHKNTKNLTNKKPDIYKNIKNMLVPLPLPFLLAVDCRVRILGGLPLIRTTCIFLRATSPTPLSTRPPAVVQPPPLRVSLLSLTSFPPSLPLRVAVPFEN